jgi:serine/threonine-protein kinase HipA
MASLEQSLHVFMNELPMGVLSRKRGGKLEFAYDSAYRSRPGAIRFVTSESLNKIEEGGSTLLSDRELEKRLADLRRDPALGREPQDRGQFSLAGAQSKTALQRKAGKWYLPWGREPTTHILKPARSDLDGHVENEHFCLRLAGALGLPVANSEVLQVGEETAIVVERYDRIMLNKRLTRVHQEDTCQALGIHPSLKYQNEGGPDAIKIMELLNRSSQPVEDRRRFMEALAFNYLIMGTDAHAKNYSLLLGRSHQVRLARLYDLASILPYVDRRKDCRLAMKVGRTYLDAQIRPRHFDQMARLCEFSASHLREIVVDMANDLPSKTEAVAGEMSESGITHPVVDRLLDLLSRRSEGILRMFKES